MRPKLGHLVVYGRSHEPRGRHVPLNGFETFEALLKLLEVLDVLQADVAELQVLVEEFVHDEVHKGNLVKSREEEKGVITVNMKSNGYKRWFKYTARSHRI